MAKRSLPYLLVKEAANLFDWPKNTLVGSGLQKELGHAKRILREHGRRLFGDKYYYEVRKTVIYEMDEYSFDDLVRILKEITQDDFYSEKFATMSMLNTYIIQKERAGYKRKLRKGALDDILNKFK